MKPGHLTTLALVSWYLLLLPSGPRHPEAGRPQVPLSARSKFAEYDNLKKCEGAMEQLIKEGHRRNDLQCVSTDDPRLKGN
jgi:hypothetical protein